MNAIRAFVWVMLIAVTGHRAFGQSPDPAPAPAPAPVVAADTYYVIVFGAQRQPIKSARHSHSFAVFIHTDGQNRTEYFTISWLSVDGVVRPYALHPEAGRNWGLQETLQLCCQNDMQVSRWGPYEINCDLWNRAVRQKAWLESGNVLYKPMDNGSKDGTISNCIHAVSYMARQPGQAVPYVFVAPANWGESGSYWITLTLEPWFIAPCTVHHQVMCRIGLNPDDYKFWTLERNPTRNPVTRVTQAVIHRHLLPNRVECPEGNCPLPLAASP